MATLANVQSAIGSNTFGTTNQWGGNIFDTAFSSALFMVCLQFAFWTFFDFGFTSYQALGNVTTKWRHYMVVWHWMYKTKNPKVEESEVNTIGNYFKTYYLGNLVGMKKLSVYSDLKALKSEERENIKRKFAVAWNAASWIQWAFTMVHRLCWTVMWFFILYAGIYGVPGALGPGTNTNGWYIAAIVFAMCVTFFHGVATTLVFSNWTIMHFIGILLEILCVLGSVGIVVCTSVLAFTNVSYFIVAAVFAGVITIGFVVIVLWEIFLASPLIFLFRRTLYLYEIKKGEDMTKST